MNLKKNYCGCVTILGATNVGKSTIFNKLIEKKISITSKKKHTTEKKIIGVKTDKNYQIIYIDNPGIKNSLNNSTNKIKFTFNLILFVVDNLFWNKENDFFLKLILKKYKNVPIILIINKIDKLPNKNILLKKIFIIKNKTNFKEIIPISAKKENNILVLKKIIKNLIPQSEHIFNKKYITNNNKIFICTEIIREKLFRNLGEEIPYFIKVIIDSFKKNKNNIYEIQAIILIKKYRHKKIILGHKGNKIKICSISSRISIEKILKNKVNLKLWVKNDPQ
ncbi:GTPase Era [Buchnera aphidicola (Neophyllaphis podocarpi)]|uniref:GTPase Era n=1 Tax=Buchnera aphidicola TaxID=9 RepID=UPI00346450BE